MATPQCSMVRQNYHPDCEAALSNQANLELHASCVYLSMAFFFDRDDVALKNFSQFFLQRSNTEREHAEKLLWLQNQRGGLTRLCNISKPETGHWECGLSAMEFALSLAKRVNQSLLNLHHLAAEKEDAHLCGFLKHHYLHEQVKFINELGGHITSLRRMGAPESVLAEHLFDKLTLGDNQKN